jgi:hypothetical protein
VACHSYPPVPSRTVDAGQSRNTDKSTGRLWQEVSAESIGVVGFPTFHDYKIVLVREFQHFQSPFQRSRGTIGIAPALQ